MNDEILVNHPNECKAGHETGFEAFSSLIGSANKNLDRLKTKGMEKYGLSGIHTLCLRQLYEAEKGLTRSELSARLSIDRAQVTRIIGDLLEEGYVTESSAKSNYRKKCLLTPKGTEVTSDVNERVRKLTQFVSGDIPSEKLDSFYETLEEICKNLKKADKYL